MRGGATLDESRSLGEPEKAVWSLGCASQKNCSNEEKHTDLQVRILCFFVAGKRLQQLYFGLLQLFVFFCRPTEYCFIGVVWRSGENPEQPSIAVFQSASLQHQLGLSRFDRRVQPNLSVLEDKWVALFLLSITKNCPFAI